MPGEIGEMRGDMGGGMIHFCIVADRAREKTGAPFEWCARWRRRDEGYSGDLGNASGNSAFQRQGRMGGYGVRVISIVGNPKLGAVAKDSRADAIGGRCHIVDDEKGVAVLSRWQIDDAFPEIGGDFDQRMGVGVPIVKISQQRNLPGVGGF